MLTFLRLIGINSALNFILIKLFIYVPTYIYLYKLFKIYLNEKLSLLSVIIFSFLPGYILTNTLLMRDNIILFLLIVALYCLLSKEYNLKILIPSLILLLFFRSYLILILIAILVFTFKNTKNLISVLDIFYLVVIVGTIYFFTNYNFTVEQSNVFFSFAQIQHLQENFINWYGVGAPMLIKLAFQTLLQLVFNPLFISFLSSGLVYLILTSLGNISGIIIAVCFGIMFVIVCLRKQNSAIRYLVKFTFYFTLLTALVLMAKDSYIINRLELMWTPLFLIIILLPFNKKVC